MRSPLSRPGALLLRRLVAESPRVLVLGVASAAAQSVLLVPIAALVGRVFDHDLPAHKSGPIVVHGLLILLLYVTAAGLAYASRVAVVRATGAAVVELRVELVAKVHALPQAWHDRQRAGWVHSLVVIDSQRVEEMLRQLASAVVPSALVAVVLTVVALIQSPLLFVTLLVVLPLSMFVAHILARRSRVRARLWLDSTHAFGTEIHRTLRAITLTKTEGREDWEIRRGQVPVDDLAARAQALEMSRAAHAAVQAAIGAVAGSLILIVGGVAVSRGALTIGELLAFYAILALLIRQLHMVGPGAGAVMVGFETLKRIEQFLETPTEDPYPDGAEQLHFQGAIAVEGVTFAYDDDPILHDVDLGVAPSEHIAILGPNGAGKSTLVSLMTGLYRPQSGRLLADGVPFDRLDMRALRRQIGVVLQDPVLVPGTIRENIAYGRPDATDDEVRAAAAAATAAAFVDRLPDGYETWVGDEGTGLSGGQRQRIAIARALIGQPRLLLLDEPTTYLDESGLTALMRSLESLPRAPTVVVVTHDPHVTAHTDRTVELRDGRVVEDASEVSRPTAMQHSRAMLP
jgi:ABC-type multidrug transport system fused ATPase/permease subunit